MSINIPISNQALYLRSHAPSLSETSDIKTLDISSLSTSSSTSVPTPFGSSTTTTSSTNIPSNSVIPHPCVWNGRGGFTDCACHVVALGSGCSVAGERVANLSTGDTAVTARSSQSVQLGDWYALLINYSNLLYITLNVFFSGILKLSSVKASMFGMLY